MDHNIERKPLKITVKGIIFASLVFMLSVTHIVFTPNISPWIATPFVLIGIILVPGLLFAINLRISSKSLIDYILYSIGLGLSFLLIGGLFINWALPYVGIAQPLARLPLMLFFDVSAILLSLWAYVFHKDRFRIFTPKLPNKTSLLFGTTPVLFLIMSVLGSQILNNGGNGILTLCMLFAIGIYVIALIVFRRHVEEWVYISGLYLISLSLLFMYSLRSTHILGWDINLEYQVFQATLQNLVWKMSYYPGLDYNACVSITIIPTIFKILTNIGSEYVFKVTSQILFAITPIVLFRFAQRFLSKEGAFLTAFLFLSQTWFYEQLPALIRQEMAFIFYALILLVLFDKNLLLKVRSILFYLFTASLILSHYSTAYIWFTLMFGVLVISYTIRFIFKSLRSKQMTFSPKMLIISIIFLLIWQIPLTHTVGKIANFVTNNNGQMATTSAITVLKNNDGSLFLATTAVSSNLSPIPSSKVVKNAFLSALFIRNNVNTDENLLIAQERFLENDPGQNSYVESPVGTPTDNPPKAVNTNITVPSQFPPLLSIIFNFLLRISKFLFIILFPIIGVIALYFKINQEHDDQKFDFIILNIAAYIFIAIMLFIPYLQIYYNFSRLYLQMFLLLSTLAVLGGIKISDRLPKYRIITLTVVMVIIFGSLSGAIDKITGGEARITLDNPPSTLDTFYIYDTEIASAKWLAVNRDVDTPIQADAVANLRLQSFGNTNSSGVPIFHQTLLKNSYIYTINLNILKNNGFYGYENNILIYNYPLNSIKQSKDLIYNNGASEIYK